MRAGCPSVLDRRALLMERGHQEQRAEEESWVPGQGHQPGGREATVCSLDTFSPSLPLPVSQDKQGLWD